MEISILRTFTHTLFNRTCLFSSKVSNLYYKNPFSVRPLHCKKWSCSKKSIIIFRGPFTRQTTTLAPSTAPNNVPKLLSRNMERIIGGWLAGCAGMCFGAVVLG